jgi:hypothetical protein
MKNLFLLFCLAICLTQCDSFPKRKKIDQLWFYSYSSNAGETDNSITPANFLSLQPDGSYTEILENSKRVPGRRKIQRYISKVKPVSLSFL